MLANGQSRRLAWVGKGVKALADQGLVAGSGFLINVLLARWFAPEQYGAYVLAFSIFLFLASLHNALLREPMIIFGPSSYRSCLPSYLGKLLRLHFALTFLLALLMSFGVTIWQSFSKSTIPLSALWGASLGIPWILFFWLWRQAAYLDLRPELAVRSAMTYAALVLVLMFMFHWLGWLSPLTAFLLQAAAGFVAGLLLIVSIRPQLGCLSIGPSLGAILKRHWEYGRWVVITAFVYWLSRDAYYVLVATLLRMEDVAALRALENFVLPIPQFITAMSFLLLPWASARFSEQSGEAFRRGISRISLLFTAAAVAYLVCISFFGKWLIALAYGGRYTQFTYLLPLVGLPVLLTAASQGAMIAVRAMQAPSEMALGYSISAMVTLVIGVGLTRYWGLVGAVVGIATSSLAFLVVITYRYQARLKRCRPVHLQAQGDAEEKRWQELHGLGHSS